MLRRRRHKIKREALVGYLFVSPVLIFFIAMCVGPMLFAVYTAFNDWNGLGKMDFVGLTNFTDLFSDEVFWLSFKNTLLYALSNVVGMTILGLISAAIINSLSRAASSIMRVAYFIPPVLAVVAASLFWKFLMYQPTYGLINTALISLGFASQGFLADPNQAFAAILVMTIWKWTGYHTVIFIAGLQIIPDEYYDSAKVDGAGSLRQFFQITLPLLKPSILFSMVINFISSFQIFDTVYVMTRGGPANTTMTVVYYMYDAAFGYMKFSYATAMGVLLFLVILFITLFQLRIMRHGGIEAY